MEAECVSLPALQSISDKGVSRIQVGIIIDGDPLTATNNIFWPVRAASGTTQIGKVTSAIYSPRLDQNIALTMVDIDQSAVGSKIMVDLHDLGELREAQVVPLPFYDPGKTIAAN